VIKEHDMLAVAVICTFGGFIAGVIYGDVVRHFVVAEGKKARAFASEEVDKLRAEVREIGDKIHRI